uniref:Uncharacterized protein n=1 Tax=Arundo donax TaxID=35708 RepID=A0A0A9C5K2_ARUDO
MSVIFSLATPFFFNILPHSPFFHTPTTKQPRSLLCWK